MKISIKIIALAIILLTVGSMSMNAQRRIYYANFSYDSDGNRISRIISVGIGFEERTLADTICGNRININQNPTTNSVFFNVTNQYSQDTVTASLMSPEGSVLETKEIGCDPVKFDLNDMASGTCIIVLRCGSETRAWEITKR